MTIEIKEYKPLENKCVCGPYKCCMSLAKFYDQWCPFCKENIDQITSPNFRWSNLEYTGA